MKKMIILFITLILVLSCSIFVSAAAEEDVLQELKDLEIFNDTYLLQAESYLARNPITSEQADKIIEKIQNVKTILGGKDSLSELTIDQKKEVFTEFYDAGMIIDLKVSFDGKAVLITDSSERTVLLVDQGSAVKQTGHNYIILLYGAAALLCALGLLLTKFRYTVIISKA